jgi:hypothetical protein
MHRPTSTPLLALTLSLGLTSAACGADEPTPTPVEPVGRTNLRSTLGASDVDVVAVTVSPDSDRPFIFDRERGLFELLATGEATLVLGTTSMPAANVEVRPPFTDLVALGDDQFAITAIGDGFLLDLRAGTLALHFCYEPGFMPEEFVQRTDAVAFDRGRGRLLAQPQTFDASAALVQSDIGLYDRASGADLEWHPVATDLRAGGMAVDDAGELFLGAGHRLLRYDFAAGSAALVADLRPFGVSRIEGLAWRAATGSFLIVDGEADELIEVGRDQLAE